MKYIEVQGRKGKSKKTAPSDVLHVYFLFLEGCMYIHLFSFWLFKYLLHDVRKGPL